MLFNFILTSLFSGFEYVTNLPLQMALYFNAFFFPFWLIGSSLMLDIEVSRKFCNELNVLELH